MTNIDRKKKKSQRQHLEKLANPQQGVNALSTKIHKLGNHHHDTKANEIPSTTQQTSQNDSSTRFQNPNVQDQNFNEAHVASPVLEANAS